MLAELADYSSDPAEHEFVSEGDMDAYLEDDVFDELDDELNWGALGRWAAGPLTSLAVAGGSKYAKSRGWLKKDLPWWAAPTAGAVVSGVFNLPKSLFADEEDGSDWLESEAAPQIIAEMEHLGCLASNANTQREADEFIAALVPLAARLIPKAASLVSKVAPRLIRGATQVARTLRRSPATRRLVRTMPTIVRQATTRMARQAMRGRPPTPRRAAATLRRQAGKTLSDRRRRSIAMRRCQILSRRLMMQNRALRMHLMRMRRRAR